MNVKLLGVVGSLRKQSSTRLAVRHVLQQAEALGAEVQILDLLETPLPMFDPHSRENEAYTRALQQVEWANGILLGSPDYHGSMSGVMKNFLDYFWKEFAGKLFGYICSSHEKGLTAMDQMRTAVRQCYGWSLPYGVGVTDGDFDTAACKGTNPKTLSRLDLLAYDITAYAPLLRKQFDADLASGKGNGGFASMLASS